MVNYLSSNVKLVLFKHNFTLIGLIFNTTDQSNHFGENRATAKVIINSEDKLNIHIFSLIG